MAQMTMIRRLRNRAAPAGRLAARRGCWPQSQNHAGAIAVLVVMSVVVFKMVLLPIRVQGISMFPSYKDGALIL